MTRQTKSKLLRGAGPAIRSIGLLVALAVAGCAHYADSRVEVSQALSDWQRPQLTVDARAAPDRSLVPPARPEPQPGAVPAAAVLADYVRLALERNPEIQAAVARVEAAHERIPQAVSLPDPFIRNVIRPEPIQTAAGDLYYTLAIGQRIPMPAKLDAAGRVAVAELRMAIEELNATRLGAIRDVEQAWHAAYLIDRYIELTRANRTLLDNLLAVVNTRYETGAASQENVLRVQTEVASLGDDERRLVRQRDSAAAQLNRLCDLPPARPMPLTSIASPQELAFQAEELMRLAEKHNPELARLDRQTQRDRERSALADLAYWPDVTLGVEWSYVDPRAPFKPPRNTETGRRPPFSRKSAAGDDNWALTLQFNVPLWIERIEAARREARALLLATQRTQHAVRNLVAFRIFDACTRIQAEQDTIELLNSTLIPQARQTYEVAIGGYQSGETSFLTVVDNWRRWLDFERLRHRATVDLENALSDLQREVGLQLGTSTSPESPAGAS